MGVIVINFFGSTSVPLSVSITHPTNNNPLTIQGSGSTANSNAGDIDSVATATGGTAPYSFAWVLSETDDPDGAFSINTQGTTNTATYNNSIITAILPASFVDPPFNGAYQVTCTVTDSVGATASDSEVFVIEAFKI